MKNELTFDLQEILCPCSGVTGAKILNLLESGRATCRDEISAITGACSGCGGCENDVDKLILACCDKN